MIIWRTATVALATVPATYNLERSGINYCDISHNEVTIKVQDLGTFLPLYSGYFPSFFAVALRVIVSRHVEFKITVL